MCVCVCVSFMKIVRSGQSCKTRRVSACCVCFLYVVVVVVCGVCGGVCAHGVCVRVHVV